MRTRWLILGAVMLAVAGLLAALGGLRPCPGAWFRWGLDTEVCPVGTPVPRVVLRALEAADGQLEVLVSAEAVYTSGGSLEALTTPLDAGEVQVALFRGDDTPVALPPVTWETAGRDRRAILSLPDGDHVLVARARTTLGPATARAELSHFRPALAHLLTDRPLYQGGDTMRFRAAVLADADLSPVEGRPVRFTVRGPDGVDLLDETVTTGPFGVAASDLPLGDNAPTGTYVVRLTSGQVDERVTVRVEPFQLPRVQLTVQPLAPWSLPGETPELQGALRLRSGAPVRDARINARVRDVAPLVGWTSLPSTRTDTEGRFVLRLPEAPAVIARLELPIEVTAVDAAGRRARSIATVVLTPSPVAVQLVTELDGGLVPDANNRVYVRATRPDGTPLPGATVRVRRAWDPADAGQSAIADEDAVAAFQLDPGPPISVVRPQAPRRAEAAGTAIVRTDAVDLLGPQGSQGQLGLDERLALDMWTPLLEPCALLVDAGAERSVSLGVAVSRTGRVERVISASHDPVDRCVAARLEGAEGPLGKEALYRVQWAIQEVPGTRIEASLDGLQTIEPAVGQALDRARRRARPCVLELSRDQAWPELLHFRVDDRRIVTRWLPVPGAPAAPSEAQSCVRAAYADLALDTPSAGEGAVHLHVRARRATGGGDLPEDVITAWGLRFEVEVDGTVLGEVMRIVEPATLPDVRIRAEPAIARPGDAVTVALLRGPDFPGTLPDEGAELLLEHGGAPVTSLAWHSAERQFTGTLPVGVTGLMVARYGRAVTAVYVPPERELEVVLTSDATTYRPGDQAEVRVRTTVGHDPHPAAVTLVGVDAALGDLTPLPGADDWHRATLRGDDEARAFGVFDRTALLTGRIRGPHAALATLLHVTDSGRRRAASRPIDVRTSTSFDPEDALIESFYGVLGDTRRAVAAWESNAEPDALLTFATVASLWREVVDRRALAGLPAADAYGIPLSLDRLPPDLLELTDPGLLVTDARHLPEDVESWSVWVRESAP